MQQTVDADVNLLPEDSEVIPVFGSSFSSAAAAGSAETDADVSAADATAVSGLSFFFAAAAGSAADVDATIICAAKSLSGGVKHPAQLIWNFSLLIKTYHVVFRRLCRKDFFQIKHRSLFSVLFYIFDPHGNRHINPISVFIWDFFI